MLLRRMIDHIKVQNWMAVTLDFVIVVSGVFIGLQVNNWSQDQDNKREYKEAIDRLRGEITANLETLDTADADVAAELPAVQAAYDALETCSDEPENRLAVNKGLAIITGTNGLQLRNASLLELTSAPRLLAQQTPAARQRLAELRFYQELVERNLLYNEYFPLEGRPARIPVLHPGPRHHRESSYLGIQFSRDRRSLELNAPVSVACKNTDLVAELWTWDVLQSTLPEYTRKMREEYKITLDLFDDMTSS